MHCLRAALAQVSFWAVGGAAARNPIPLILPCRRAAGTNGSLAGYAGGIGRRLALLKLEKADLSKIFVPRKAAARPLQH